MSRRWLLFLLCLSLPLLLCVQLSRASGALKVNEATTRFSLRDDNPQLQLAVENGSRKSFNAVVRIEFVDPNDKIKSSTAPSLAIHQGNQKLELNLPFKISQLGWSEQSQLLWYRVRYRIEPDLGAGIAPISGTMSLSEITPDLFEIRVASSTIVREGMRYRVTVQAQHPLTNGAARGVEIYGTVEFDDDDTDEKTVLKARGVTDKEGFAVLDFELPRKINDDDIDLTVTGHRDSLSVEENRNIDLSRKPYIIVSSDKPIYQPGQVLHARVLMFGPSKRAIANSPITLKINDPDGEVSFRTELKTSNFGIASADWSIPANTRLGNYQVQFSTEDEDNSNSAWVKISRYDLPNFTVNIKPDRSYYLPQQNAAVEVEATYLFGQPVKRGHVRVVRETERSWNYREQKYDVEEGKIYEGETDANGVFKVRIDLTKDQAELRDTDYERFQDLSYAAYFTDPTTNRTEQRRFDLRITKEAIHIYVVKSKSSYYENSRLPLQFYVSTSYADGAPAPCRVLINRESDSNGRPDRPLRSIKTNRYGAARVQGIDIRALADTDSDLKLNFLASDSQGRTGKHSEGYYLRDEPSLRVATDKTIYRAGEPIEVTLTSSERDASALLEVSRDSVVLHSEVVRVRGGRATVTLPWGKELTDRLMLTAYYDSNSEDDDFVMGRRTILFPRNRELRLGLQSNHKEYRPGEDAQFTFRVRDPEGRSAASALGVVVFDKAVEERARTDQEFGDRGRYSSDELLRWLGDGDVMAGISLKELNKIDLSKPIDPDLELLAEMMLNQGEWYYPHFFGGNRYNKSREVFSPVINTQFKPVRAALETRYSKTRQYPTDETSLKRILSQAGVDYAALRDPWTIPYRASFSFDGKFDLLKFTSAGPDKRFDTGDDLNADQLSWAYFLGLGGVIDRTVYSYHQRTGRFIRDYDLLRSELTKANVDLDGLRDRWLHPYKIEFAVTGNMFEIRVSSAGPNGVWETKPVGDDVTLWGSGIDYFAESRAAIDTALANSLKVTNRAPKNEVELRAVLQSNGLSLDQLRDGWNQRYYPTFQERAFYGDHATIEMRGEQGKPPTQTITVKPVTKRVITITLRSPGPDRHEGTIDDFSAGVFTATVSEQEGTELVPQVTSDIVSFNGSTGAIRGVITDPLGAVVPGVRVQATRSYTSETFEATSNDDGRYLLKNLPVGRYSILIDAPGFKRYIVDHVLVQSSNVVDINAVLSVGAVSEVVTVSAGVSSLDQTSSASVGATITGRQVVVLGAGKQQLSTPRLREYFPETLVWQPSLETDRQGRAQLSFKLADNITTWKMAVIGSTEDGQIGTVEKEFKSFQPFFVEHDPPRILTEGDEISLPVVVRNYLQRSQTVNLEIKPETWFSLLGPATKSTEVPAGDANRQSFDLRATASVTDGKQRITARGADADDAIEKPVTVHPDGEEQSVTATDIVNEGGTLTFEIPATLVPNSAQGELKIYPNLMAHVAESVEAIMKRPYGCGEQTISSTYPSLLLLRHNKLMGQRSALNNRAEEYLRDGYNRLLNYRHESGGFTYWGRGEPDLALTAYALRFLNDARELITVDDDVIQKTRTWLLKQQSPDGRWVAHNYWDKIEDTRRSALLTAYIARVVARSGIKPQAAGVAGVKLQAPSVSPELKRALDYLSIRVREIDEPYLLSSYVLASLSAHDTARAALPAAKLASLAHVEGGGIYWELEMNTPFYGWGLAGRIETSALAVQALAQGCKSERDDSSKGDKTGPASQSTLCNRELLNRGLLFLLKQKDRYGVWYSSQATINVLDALLAVLPPAVPTPPSSKTPTAEIIVNGASAKSVAFPPEGQSAGPVIVNLAAYLRAGSNRVEIRRAAGSSPASIQAVATYYVPWSVSQATTDSAARPGKSSGLRLTTRFDRTEGNVSDEISCHVEAERIGFKGYGMMLAEIGLPPGADVDRASLDEAIKRSDWSISQYDILPDRVVVYLWPRAGGVAFDFKFRPRFGLRAKTAPSSIYDYYNPEARAVVRPTSFVVKSGTSIKPAP